ncbi:MAG TPA: dethiobiotin synthase [Verrucomicrobiae bacterium]|nr:dethiobiotin synthase [Verrucomicrobiae bacterium]
MSAGLFITGTDTGVGKTYVTAALLAELRRRGVRAAAFKPVACGTGGRHDAEIYAGIMNHEQPIELINPVYLRHPLAPGVAARLERRRIDLRRIRDCYQRLSSAYSVVLVEGAGGLLVPIRDDYFVADLAKSLGLPLLVVGRLGLGTINHSLLTVRAAQDMGLKVRGLVLNDTVGGKRGLAATTNIETVPELCRIPLLGVMPHGKHGMRAAARQICDRLFGRQPD